MADYARRWDSYVEGVTDGLPGDEWGEPEQWEAIFDTLLRPFVADWERAVEIGQGSGKYTLKVLAESEATVRAYDVSERFLDVCAQRCRDEIEAGRLSLHPIRDDPAQMLSELHDWRREIDAFYSIDAMVHVDLQDLIAYLLTAALTLRQGGKLILTLADVTTPQGFKKLLTDIRQRGTGNFKWLSPEIVKTTLMRLGFDCDLIREAGQDMIVVATLRRPRLAEAFERYLADQAQSHRRQH